MTRSVVRCESYTRSVRVFIVTPIFETPVSLGVQKAFKYLGVVLFPLFIGYGVYSLLYQEHKGWYSFLLSMSYGFLLTFGMSYYNVHCTYSHKCTHLKMHAHTHTHIGFITMTPQLFINYKLKSVAHLPWRMLTYKALNTFIDDMFAFVIKMPTMYRIGCFRDGTSDKNVLRYTYTN